MLKFLKLHLHPLGGRIIFWNFVLLLAIKVVIPYSAFQSASLLGLTPPFDSREIIKVTNEARIAQNLQALRPDAKLDLAAAEKLNDMAIQEYFAHTSPTGVNPWYWIKDAQYKYSVAGENLAIGFVTANDTVQGWLNSPSHRANILNEQYLNIGVAVKSVEINGREGVLVVQMFGKPLSSTVAIAKTPAPTPSSNINPTPVKLTNALPQTEGETITVVQEVSTDTSVKSVKEPIAVQSYNSEKIVKVSNVLNNAFSIYAMIISAFTITAFFLFERSKGMAFKMALNVALLILVIMLPASQISSQGLIF